MSVSIPSANAENNLLLELSDQLNQEQGQFMGSVAVLQEPSSHLQSARKWAKELRALPKQSKDYEFARANMTKEKALYLENKIQAVSNLEQASASMTGTIERLIDAHASMIKNNRSLFSAQDNQDVIHAKIKTVKGLDSMINNLIQASPGRKSQKLGLVRRVLSRYVKNVRHQVMNPGSQSINAFYQLKSITEGIAMLAKTHLDDLREEARQLTVVSIDVEVKSIGKQAANILNSGIGVLSPNKQDEYDYNMLIATTTDPGYEISENLDSETSISDDLDAIESTLANRNK